MRLLGEFLPKNEFQNIFASNVLSINILLSWSWRMKILGWKKNEKILKTTLLWTSRSVQATKENCYFGLQVSVLNPNSSDLNLPKEINPIETSDHKISIFDSIRSLTRSLMIDHRIFFTCTFICEWILVIWHCFFITLGVLQASLQEKEFKIQYRLLP